MIRRIALTVVVGFLLINPASADSAPAALFNKSLTVTLSIYTPAKGSDGSNSASRTIQQLYYVSSQGRVFSKASHASNQYTSQKETKHKGPENKSVQFSGGAIVAIYPMISGAGQLRITFDPSYQSCTANAVVGNESGKPISYVGFNGVTYTATGKTQISNVSCSIRDGNAFAN